ncbi:iron ABC transporter permease [Canibacter sp. lx-45]|uniref:FecCD family ABC transporter permease n=1 Tax=Canibacter zhuwentaonis TaxID=2837491 RepID=UPI001BDCEACE|nr:iron ABC transporter permease [Canibacter zhuwentaonis]MBT1035593.1 iron ABC transporter permease [Canibacter zhuwentaonis]
MTAEISPGRPKVMLTSILAGVLIVLLIGAFALSVLNGQLAITPHSVLDILLEKIGVNLDGEPADLRLYNTLWSIRFPRVVLAAIVGAALALAGLLMQAIFGNPLAEPSIVGVSSGAALGAGFTIVFGVTIFGIWTIAAAAAITGLIATLVVYFMSRASGRTEVVTLVLTGIAVNAVCGAGIALLTYLGDTSAREQLVFWQLGSISGARWSQVTIVTIALICAIFYSFHISRRLDLLSLGERNARHLGVQVETLRISVIIIVAVIVGAAVAFTGIIAFVGLVIPHLMRMILGPAHLPLVITSALGGALLLTLADLGSRTIMPLTELPIGMLTSLLGGPFFFWMLRKTRKQAGGWG